MRKNWIFLLIVLVGLAIRLVFALTCDNKPEESDMETYNRLALEAPLSVYPPPGYPLFLKTVYAIFGTRNYRAAFAAQGIVSALSILLIYWITMKASSRRAGLIAAGIAAVYPNLIIFNLTTMTETLSVFCYLLVAAALALPIRPRRQAMITAVVYISTFLVRPVFIYAWPGVLLAAKRRLVFLLAFLALLSPAVIYGIIEGTAVKFPVIALYKTYNKRSNGYQNLSLKALPLGEEERSAGTYLREVGSFIKTNRRQTIDIIHGKLRKLFGRGWDTLVLKPIVGDSRHFKELLMYGYIPVMLLGFIGMIRCYGERNRHIALTMLGYLVFLILLAPFKFRYRLVIEPHLIMYGGILVDRICGWNIFARLRQR